MESSKNYNKFITNNIKNLKQRKTKFKNEWKTGFFCNF
jgi:hypothetical protein